MVIDFHSHILPGVDHGSKNLDESKKQLSLVCESGVDIIVATSHFYPHVHKLDSFIEMVDVASEKIATLKEHVQNMHVCLGAEVLVCDMLDKMPGLERLCIRGTNLLLLEMPSPGSWGRYIQSVENIMNDGYTVVLAHIDRYMANYQDGIEKLLMKGARAQINADGLDSFFAKKKLMNYIEGGAVYAIGSDLHGSDKKSYKSFLSAPKRIGAENYDMIMKRSEKLLADAESII